MHQIGPRIKFGLHRLHEIRHAYPEWEEMAKGLQAMQRLGMCPVEGDGKMAGNIAIKVKDTLLVSKSGRSAEALGAGDFVQIFSFDRLNWKADYASLDIAIEPSSDTPLFWAALLEAPYELKWPETPSVALHGHAFQTEKAAKELSLPISMTTTDYSTCQDREALYELLSRYPYPANKIFIRKGHGFFILENSVQKALDLLVSITRKCSDKQSVVQGLT